MSENTVPDIDIISHLDSVDLTKIDRSRIIIKGGTYDVTVQAIEIKDTKPNPKQPKGGKRLSITLALNTKAENNDPTRAAVNPGFVIFDSISLMATDKYNPLERLADIQNACFGEQRQGFKIPDYIGKRVLVKVKVESDDEFGEQNRVTRWVPKKDPTANQAPPPGVPAGAAAPGSL